MNELFVALGIGGLKPVITALLLPPVPLLLLIALGAAIATTRRGWSRWLIAVGIAGIWFSACSGCGHAITRLLLRPPPALDGAQIRELAARTRAGGSAAPTIVVLGGGREAYAPEYALPDLKPRTLARLRYGAWLAQRTGAALVYSGGAGWAQPDGAPEAEIAARVAGFEFGRPLAWAEGLSRDTRGNAAGTVAGLRERKVTEAVIVTDSWHMPRALRLFERAAGGSVRFTAAPIGMARGDSPVFDWLPTSEGFELVRSALREIFARAAGD